MIAFHCTAHSFLIIHALSHPVNFLHLFHPSLSHFVCFLIIDPLDSTPLASSCLHLCWSLHPLKGWSGSIIVVHHNVSSLLFLFWIVTTCHLEGFSCWCTLGSLNFKVCFLLLWHYHLLIHWNPLVFCANFRGSANSLQSKSSYSPPPIHFPTSFRFISKSGQELQVLMSACKHHKWRKPGWFSKRSGELTIFR